MKTRRSQIAPALLAAGLLAGGCSTIENSHRQKEPLLAAWMAADTAAAQSELASKVRSRTGTGDELVWRLEAGTWAFAFGRYADAVAEFAAAERVIADYDERASVSARDVGSEAAGALSNLNVLPYRGWCRDRMALEIYKSLSYLGQGREDAFRAQVKRLRERQKEIQEDYAKFFEQEKAEIDKARADNPAAAKQADEQGSVSAISGNAQNAEFTQSLAEMRQIAHRGYGGFLNPLALYLSALGNLRDGNWDNAAIDTKRLHEALPANPFVNAFHATTLRNAGRPLPAELSTTPAFPYPMDRDCLYVIFANGRGAAFRQISIYWPIMVAWPACEFYHPPFSGAQVSGGGQTVTTVPLADMDAILAQEFEQRLPGIITRTLLATLIKEGAYRGGQWATLHASNDWRVQAVSFAAVTVAGTAYRYAMNTADTRCWELLPKEFQVAQLPMPADRKVRVSLGGRTMDVAVPAGCRSAVLYVSAPSQSNVRCSVLPFSSK